MAAATRLAARCGATALLALAPVLGHAQGVDWTLIGGAADESSVKQLGVVAGWTRPERALQPVEAPRRAPPYRAGA